MDIVEGRPLDGIRGQMGGSSVFAGDRGILSGVVVSRGDQNPHPVSAESADTGTGHPLTFYYRGCVESGTDGTFVGLAGTSQTREVAHPQDGRSRDPIWCWWWAEEIKISAPCLQKAQTQGRAPGTVILGAHRFTACVKSCCPRFRGRARLQPCHKTSQPQRALAPAARVERTLLSAKAVKRF